LVQFVLPMAIPCKPIRGEWKVFIQSRPPRAFLVQFVLPMAIPCKPIRGEWKVFIQFGPPRAFMGHCVPNGNLMPIQCPKSLFNSLCSQWPFFSHY
jgi:hypothetical protein